MGVPAALPQSSRHPSAGDALGAVLSRLQTDRAGRLQFAGCGDARLFTR